MNTPDRYLYVKTEQQLHELLMQLGSKWLTWWWNGTTGRYTVVIRGKRKRNG